MPSRRLVLLGAGVAGLVLVAVAVWLFDTRAPVEPGKGSNDLAAAPAKPGPDPFGFSAAFGFASVFGFDLANGFVRAGAFAFGRAAGFARAAGRDFAAALRFAFSFSRAFAACFFAMGRSSGGGRG